MTPDPVEQKEWAEGQRADVEDPAVNGQRADFENLYFAAAALSPHPSERKGP